MRGQEKTRIVSFYHNWKEPICGTALSVILVTADILVDSLSLPRTKARAFLIQAVQEDLLRTLVLFLGPTIGFFMRHFRIKREQLFKDLANTLIRIVDHEIRNPLMMIIGASSLMKQSDPEDAKRLQQVGQGVERIVEAVANLGVMANITTSKFYNIRDYLKNSVSPARDLKSWASRTAIIEPPNKKP